MSTKHFGLLKSIWLEKLQNACHFGFGQRWLCSRDVWGCRVLPSTGCHGVRNAGARWQMVPLSLRHPQDVYKGCRKQGSRDLGEKCEPGLSWLAIRIPDALPTDPSFLSSGLQGRELASELKVCFFSPKALRRGQEFLSSQQWGRVGAVPV